MTTAKHRNPHRALALAALAALSAHGARGQDPQEQDPQPMAPRPTPQQAMGALERWLESDRSDAALMDKATAAVLDSGALGQLADEIRRVPADDGRRRAGLDAVLTSLGLEFLRREQARGVIFAGQFEPLRPLQPWIGQLYLHLLLDPPNWFPDTRRAELVPALRDLFLQPPPAEDVDRIEALAEDKAREPEVLRLQLSFALAQWGRRELAQAVVRQLEVQCENSDKSKRIYPLYFLADVHYQMRNYRAAVETHARHIELAEQLGHPLRPLDFYNAACCASLEGEIDRAVTWLQACAALQRSDGVDSSVKLSRSLFTGDPETRALRADPRFASILRDAFPEPGDANGGRSGGGR